MEETKMKKMFLLVLAAGLCLPMVVSAQSINMTANTLFAARADGSVIYNERWNTYAPHPAWDVFVRDGAIPGTSFLNKTDGVAPDRTIDIPLTVGNTYTFTFGVSHGIGGDLGFEYYGLNLFLGGSPSAANGEEAPSISVYAQPDRNGPADGNPAFMANFAAATMGFPLADLPGAGLVFDNGSIKVELTDFVVYAKSAGLGLDFTNQGSQVGPFVPDQEPDVIGEYTLVVTPEPMTMGLLGLGGLALIRRRRA